MKKLFVLIAGGILLLGSSCTERRKDTPPVPNGDTVEVVVPESLVPSTTPDSIKNQ